jgi:hypothetical protein
MDYDLEDRLGAAEDLAPIAQGGSGEVVTITSPGVDTFNPATDTTTPGTPVVQTGSGVEDTYSAFAIGTGLVLAGDVKFLLSALNSAGAPLTPPVAGQSQLTKADGTWAIMRADPLQPAGTPVMFTLQLRRA